MGYGVLIESQLTADTLGTMNKSAMSTATNFDGGNLVSLVAPAVTTGTTSQGNVVWQASIPTADTLGNLFMAYNPVDRITRDVNGNEYSNLSADPRAYTNLTDRPFTAFKVRVEDEIVINEANVDSTASTIVVGDILESKAGQVTLTRIAASTGATVGNTAFKVISIDTLQYPAVKGSIGMDNTTVYRCVCVQEA